MVIFLISIIASLLPARYRGRWLGDAIPNVQRGAIVSGFLQFVGCAAGLWIRYPAFIQGRMAEAAAEVVKRGGDKMDEGVAVFAIGGLALWEYLVQPLSLVMFYFIIEGCVRIFAAVAGNEVLPTMPLQLVASLQGLGEKQSQNRYLGPLIGDLVSRPPSGCDLRIESCRPKEWTALTTISYEESLYELQDQSEQGPPRRFVYRLRKAPLGKVVRGLYHYHPDEHLPPPKPPRA